MGLGCGVQGLRSRVLRDSMAAVMRSFTIPLKNESLESRLGYLEGAAFNLTTTWWPKAMDGFRVKGFRL